MPSSRFTRLVLVTFLAAGLGCDDNKPAASASPDGGTGAGGSTGSLPGSGGTTGTPGSGGTSAGPGTDAAPGVDTGTPGGTCNVPCLADIGKDCVPMGTCVEQMSGFAGRNRCYTNGVKIISTENLAVPPAPSTMIITYSKGTQVCYSIEVKVTSLTPNVATGVATWKNAAGTAVATGTYNFGTMKATVMCGNQAFEPNPSCAAAMNLPISGASAPATTCTMGACM